MRHCLCADFQHGADPPHGMVWRRLCLAVALGTLASAASADDAAQPPAGNAAAATAESGQVDSGQGDLDDAIDRKLSANDYDDLGKVIELCQKAKRKGLSEDQRKFADDLEADTLVTRAGLLVEEIFEGSQPGAQKMRMRSAALRDLNAAIAINSEIGSAQLMLARLEALPTGNRERARAAANKALELIGEDRLEQAKAHVVRGGLAESDEDKRSDFDKAVELAPRNVEVRRTRGLFRLLEEDYDGALEDIDVAIDEDGDDASLHEARGIALMMSDKLDEAIESFDRAIEIDPDLSGPLLQRARVLAMQGDQEAAIDTLQRAIAIDPDDAVPLVLRARIRQQSGDTDGAMEDLRLVLEDHPDHQPALELRGLIAADKGDYPSAIRDFRRLVAANTEDALLVGQLGMLYLAAKQPREAIRRFTRALEIDEKQFLSRRGRSDAEIAIGEHAAALADLEKAHEAEPDNTAVLNNLAWLLSTSPEDAVRDGRRAIELANRACELTEWKESHIISTLAAAHAESGDFEQARTYSSKAVETGSDVPEIKAQLQQELESYKAEKPWREKQQQEEAVLGAKKDDLLAGQLAADGPDGEAAKAAQQPNVADDDDSGGETVDDNEPDDVADEPEAAPAPRTPRRPFQ